MLSRLALASMALFLAVPGPSRADDWPQWRGPRRDGISRETGLLSEWPKDGPKLLWQATEIGDGYSTPAVVGGRLYLMSNKGEDDEFVQARSVADGSEIWTRTVGKVGPNRGPKYPGSRSTPTVDGDSLYALGSDGDLVCLAIETGEVRWKKNLRNDFAGQPGNWAYSESVLVDGDVVVCTPGGSEATIVALNKQTGETVWKSAVPGGDEAAYASPVVAEAAGVRQYVQFLQKGLVGVNAQTGEFLWRYEKTAQGSPANIPTPVVHGEYVYSASGRGGAALVKLSAQEGGVAAKQVYATPRLPTAIGGAVLVDGNLYGTNRQGLVCAEFLTGEVKWAERGIGAAALCFADGRLYLHGENGDVALVEATPEGHRERGRFTPPGQPDHGPSRAWAYPVVANGRLYIRDLGSLWCYGVKGE